MQDIIIFAGLAAVAGVAIGAFSGAWFADRRLRRHYEEVRGEVASLRALAEDKLSGDDPDLDTLLNNIHTAVDGAYRAIEAMETQAAITKRKSEGGREVIASSRQIMRMIDELTGGAIETFETRKQAPTIAPKAQAPIAPEPAAQLATKPVPKLAPKLALVREPPLAANPAPKLTAHPLAQERQNAEAKK